MDFKGKVAVITGAASGIGRGVAIEMAKLGADIVTADLDDKNLESACKEIKSLGRRALLVHCDVSKDADVENLAKQTFASMGKCDILMNNAGTAVRGPVEHLTVANWEWLVQINFLGVIRGVRAFLPYMLQRGSGYIINTGSGAGFNATEPPGLFESNIPYAATKFGLVGLSEGLFGYLRPKGIAVSVLCPGFVATNLSANVHFVGDDEKEFQLKPEDIQKEKEALFSSPDVETPEGVAKILIKGMNEDRFLIFTHAGMVKSFKEERGQDFGKLEQHLQKKFPK
ncbi:MAG: SDR family oxidoreductase [Dehalococcoidales bacterium]|nr:SDR family oxidoreductase [Dehalococcoidales bacterium]